MPQNSSEDVDMTTYETARLSIAENPQDPVNESASPPYYPQTHNSPVQDGPHDDFVIRSGFKAFPVVDYYPKMSNGEEDEEVKNYKYNNFARPVLSGGSMPRLSHYSLRYWVEYKSPDGEPIEESERPDLIENKHQRATHSAVLIDKLVRDQVITRDEVSDLSLYYGTTTPITQLAGGIINKGPDAAVRFYLDVKLAYWSEKLYEKMITPNRLVTDRTRMVFLGEEKGIGPIAHPSYVIAECEVPDRMDNDITGQDHRSFRRFMGLAIKSFTQHRLKTGSDIEVVAAGGFFDEGSTKLSWDYRLFLIFKVIIKDEELLASNDPTDFRDQIEKFPPYTMFGTRFARNSYSFRKGCSECKNNATFIHNESNHKCDNCGVVGHIRIRCPSIVALRKKRAWQEEEPMTFMAPVDGTDNSDYRRSMETDPARLRFMKAKEIRERKKRRMQ